VQWPARFFERVLRPLPIDVHQWRVTGLGTVASRRKTSWAPR